MSVNAISKLLCLITLGLTVIGSGCSVKHMAVNKVGDALAGGPGLRVKIPIHQELSEAEERQRNLPPYGPGFLDL